MPPTVSNYQQTRSVVEPLVALVVATNSTRDSNHQTTFPQVRTQTIATMANAATKVSSRRQSNSASNSQAIQAGPPGCLHAFRPTLLLV